MSALASGTSDRHAPLPPWRPPAFVRWLDLAVLVVALPVFLGAGLPIVGWVAGSAVWCAQRAIQVWAERRANASKDPRTMVGLMAGSLIGRGWLVALTIFLVGLGNSHDGLAAAVLVIVTFTVYFTIGIIVRSLSGGKPA